MHIVNQYVTFLYSNHLQILLTLFILHQFAVFFSFFIHILLSFIATDCQYALHQKIWLMSLCSHARRTHTAKNTGS